MKIIQLSKGKQTIVDDEDFENLSQIKWHFNKKGKSSTGYAQHSKHVKLAKWKYTSKTIYMHNFIMNTPEGFVVDHINGDTLDNRKENLRVVLQSVNMRNRRSCKNSTSKYVGVHLHRQNNKWRTQIKINGKIYDLGMFESQELAKEAREAFIERHNLEGFRR